jgi:co-chaperonin GroES (HSP10)
MKMRVMGENLLVKAQKMEKVTESGIVVAQEKSRHDNASIAAVIVDVGPLAFHWEKGKNVNVSLPEKGCYVLTKKYAGVNFDIGDDQYKIISDSDVLAWVDADTIEKMRAWV